MNFNKITKDNLNKLGSIVSPDRLSTGDSILDLHSKDESRHKPCRPEVVIWPADRFEVSAILKYANNSRIPVTCWGSGSSLEGNPIPVQGGIVLDFNRMNRILNIREEDFQADVEPGVVYQDLNEQLKYKGLFFPPDPGARATIGGMIANNASGIKTVRYGSTKDHVLRLSVITADGEIMDIGTRASKTSSGYDLIHLFVGAEGTLGVVVEATVRLTGLPEELSAAIANFPSVENTAKTVFEIIRAGLSPAGLELLGPECIDLINKEKELGLNVSPTLFMEFHGPTTGYLSDVLDMVEEICKENGCTDFSPGIGRSEMNRLLKARHELAETITRSRPGCRMHILDVAVPITSYGEMIATAAEETKASGLTGYTFSHAGDGNIHLVFMGKKNDEKEWAKIDEVTERVVNKAISLGGTSTGEHGVGIGKRKFMDKEHGAGLKWMKRIKDLFDPNGILNPGKIFFDSEDAL
jgi:D-lactate dehydrogenase (cytochrome)